MKKRLFEVLGVHHPVIEITINGYEIDELGPILPGHLCRLGCGDDPVWFCPDQEIEIDADGEDTAIAYPDDDLSLEPETITIRFEVVDRRPINASDFIQEVR